MKHKTQSNYRQETDTELTDGIELEPLLDRALKQIKSHKGQKKVAIVRAIMGAVIAQEMSRMLVTKQEMVAGLLQIEDRDTLVSDWRVLARHYAGTKYQKLFEAGAEQIRLLSPSESQKVIREIRSATESILNKAMREKKIRVGFKLPFLGEIGKFYINVQGPVTAIRRFQGRMARRLVQSVLWIAVVFGTAHWISWTIFNQSYFSANFEGLAKLTQFLLLIPTTLVVWVFARRGKNCSRSKWLRDLLRLAAWFAVAAGWCYWVVWLILGIPSGIPGIEEATKLSLPFFLACGSFGAWIAGRVFQEGQDGQN